MFEAPRRNKLILIAQVATKLSSRIKEETWKNKDRSDFSIFESMHVFPPSFFSLKEGERTKRLKQGVLTIL